MAFLKLGQERVIAAISGAWVTAFVLVAIWSPSALVEAVLGVLAFVLAYLLWRMNWRLLSAYAIGSGIVLILAALFKAGVF